MKTPPLSPTSFSPNSTSARRRGKIGWILLWLVGVPIPVLLLLFLVRGCT